MKKAQELVERQQTAVQTPIPMMNIDALFEKAIEKGMSVEGLERLMKMRADIQAEQAKKAFFAAKAAFQSECPIIPKTKEVKNKGGGSTRYRYAPLETIIEHATPFLRRHGFSYSIETEIRTDIKAVYATCTAHHQDGHSESSTFGVPIDAEAFMNDAQKVASAQTFAKRYAFCNCFGLMTGDEDDDAQALGQGANLQDVYRRAAEHMQAVLQNYHTIVVIKDAIANKDCSVVIEAWDELDNETKQKLWLAPTKGGCFTTNERDFFRSNEMNAKRKEIYGHDTDEGLTEN